MKSVMLNDIDNQCSIHMSIYIDILEFQEKSIAYIYC